MSCSNTGRLISCGLMIAITFGCSFAMSQSVFAQSGARAPSSTRTVEVAVIETDHGEMLIEMWPEVAPKTVENFKKLAGEEFYNGQAFHRIIDGFMVQGGDPLSKDESARARWGTGGPGYTIDAEFSKKKHVRGVISMARSADPNSAGSQFFVCLGDATFLDEKYTAFGKLVAGDDVLEKLGKTEVEQTGEKSKPVSRCNLKSIKFEEREIPVADDE